RAEKMHGYYLSEDEGRLLKIFPDNETLRYQIPFTDPVETIHYLKQIADHHPHSVVVFGDDGEKFGAWPGTYDHVYRDGWLRRFLDLLRQNSDWLKVTTLGESVDTVSPMGSCYLPDASYREMNEWALSSERQLELSHLKDKFSEDEEFDRLKPYLRGGFWRNFRVKYSELNEMYSRMLLVSSRLQSLEATGVDAEDLPILHEARTELYRAQCNCPYWHGAFGGLYLPHLRNAIFKHLISADSLLEKINHRDNNWLEVEAADFNLDARKEIRLASHRLVSFLSPAHGGHLYELDIRGAKHNLLATLCRRPEPYHDIIRQAAQEQAQGGQNGDDIGKIHNAVRFKQPGLEQKLQYDNTPRKSLMDHFYQPGVDLDTVINGGGELGDFVEGVYLSSVRRTDDECDVRMSRKGHVGPYEVEVTKTVSLSKSAAGTLVVQYELSNLPTEVPLHFGVEFNFAGMAAGASDRYYYNHMGKQLGQLESKLDLEKLDRIGLVDEWLGLDAALDLSSPANIWTFPIETISQSEGGYELVHQSSVVIPHWEFVADDEGRWSVTITLSLDTSAAQAKALSEAAASGA
ncbi:MAG: alpha-amylase, partial [Gimesia sp.]|nr:alpha-amylase [Gimesia sp.]